MTPNKYRKQILPRQQQRPSKPYQVACEGDELLKERGVEEVLAAADDRVLVLELTHQHLGQALHQHRQRRLRVRVARDRDVAPYNRAEINTYRL